MKVRMFGALFGIVGLLGVLPGWAAESTSEDVASTSDQLVNEGEKAESVKRVFEGDSTEAEDEIEAVQATVSFTRTCTGWYYEYISGGPVTYAQASSCRRRNGTWGGFTSWSPDCYSDVANCDGKLRCGRC